MDLHEEAGKENEEATSKDEIEIYVFVLGDLGQDSPIQTSRSVNKS